MSDFIKGIGNLIGKFGHGPEVSDTITRDFTVTNTPTLILHNTFGGVQVTTGAAGRIGVVATRKARGITQATLATALQVPLRERNALLLAAGYAPVYRETRLDAPELEPALRALDLILKHQEPYPAVVLDAQWDVLRANDAGTPAAVSSTTPRVGSASALGRPLRHSNRTLPSA